jgi:hypothetical protein
VAPERHRRILESSCPQAGLNYQLRGGRPRPQAKARDPDNDSLHALTDEQVERLATIVLEDFGPRLYRTQCNDVVRALFEDVAGFEVMTRAQAAEHLRALWITYRRLVRSNRSH